jgi:hypothetical protein
MAEIGAGHRKVNPGRESTGTDFYSEVADLLLSAVGELAVQSEDPLQAKNTVVNNDLHLFFHFNNDAGAAISNLSSTI